MSTHITIKNTGPCILAVNYSDGVERFAIFDSIPSGNALHIVADATLESPLFEFPAELGMHAARNRLIYHKLHKDMPVDIPLMGKYISIVDATGANNRRNDVVFANFRRLNNLEILALEAGLSEIDPRLSLATYNIEMFTRPIVPYTAAQQSKD